MKTIKALLFALAIGCSGSALAMGAIAVDDNVGDEEPGYGFSTGHKTKDGASKAAMRECRKAGNKDCKVKVWFETCGAYASSKRYYGVGWGATQKKAESMALEQCGRRNCEIQISECEE